MKTILLKILGLAVVLALLFTGCSLDDPDHPTSLQARPVFASYVAIGNSLTAGYMDSGLMQAGQANSYPQLIANQLGLDGTAFSQPWVAAPGIGSTNTGDPSVIAGVLHFNGSAPALLGTTPAAQVPGLLLAASQPTPYHNLGVPGATVGDVFSAYSAATSQGPSPFFDFINRASLYGNSEREATVFAPDSTLKQVTYQTTSMGWQSIAKGPSLLTVWIGNNDVLGGATGGNPVAGVNLTPPTVFGERYSDMMQLLAGGLVQSTGFPATIVVANIPSVTDVAYFISEATFEAAAGGAWPWGYAEGNAELLTFTVLSWIQNAANQGSPIPSNYTLTADEAAVVGQHVAGYNQEISEVVAGINASGMAKVGLVDANAIMAGLSNNQKTHFMLLLPQVAGSIPTAAATTIFSLDGVHPNNHGYGTVANAFLEVINTLTDSDVPLVDTASLVWDPTYGVPVDAKSTGLPVLSPEAAEAMTAIWR